MPATPTVIWPFTPVIATCGPAARRNVASMSFHCRSPLISRDSSAVISAERCCAVSSGSNCRWAFTSWPVLRWASSSRDLALDVWNIASPSHAASNTSSAARLTTTRRRTLDARRAATTSSGSSRARTATNRATSTVGDDDGAVVTGTAGAVGIATSVVMLPPESGRSRPRRMSGTGKGRRAARRCASRAHAARGLTDKSARAANR